MDAKVRDVMTPGPIGVDYYQSIGEAARTMRDWGIAWSPTAIWWSGRWLKQGGLTSRSVR